MKVIKTYLTPQQVSLQLVKPHNHHVNAAKRAIQIFKNQFIGALGTTNANFPIRLWDKLAPLVQDSINLICLSCVHPDQSAYKTLEGPYDWNCYLMAPPCTKAIIYENSNTRTSWAPHSLDAWLLGPSKDHYHCHIYYFPKTNGYQVSRSTNLFPQHCITPPYSHKTHVSKLSTELQDTLKNIPRCNPTLQDLRTLAQHLDVFVSDTPSTSSPPTCWGL